MKKWCLMPFKNLASMFTIFILHFLFRIFLGKKQTTHHFWNGISLRFMHCIWTPCSKFGNPACKCQGWCCGRRTNYYRGKRVRKSNNIDNVQYVLFYFKGCFFILYIKGNLTNYTWAGSFSKELAFISWTLNLYFMIIK